MIKIIADLHTHTLANDHAFSTLEENIAAAKRTGMRALGMAEHCHLLTDSPRYWHIGATTQLPRYCDGILLIHGAEANVADADGNIDIDLRTLVRLDLVIASMHDPVYPGYDVATNSRAWINIARNPYVDVIGHSGTENHRYDYERVIEWLGKMGKAVEINNHSYAVRAGAAKNCREIALICKKLNVPIIVSSDAHKSWEVGIFDEALQMLDEIDFPERLVLNADLDRLIEFINSKPHKLNKIVRSE